MMNKEDIKAFEGAVKWGEISGWVSYGIDNGEEIKNPDVIKWHKDLLKAATAYIKLLKGEHDTDVIVPREPTEVMSEAAFKKGIFMLKGERIHPGINISTPLYKTMIQAGQEGDIWLAEHIRRSLRNS